MKRMLSVMFVGIILIGCGTIPYKEPMTINPIVPGENEVIKVDQIVIIVDSSRSMKDYKKFSVAKSLTESFVAAMPDGDYLSTIVYFGGECLSKDDNKEIIIQQPPLQPFNRSQSASYAARMEYISGNTPLEETLDDTYDIVKGQSGHTAIVLFSDGLPTFSTGAYDSAKRIANNLDEVCIYPVQVGNTDKGAHFLQSIAKLTPCGSYWSYTEISEGSAMMEFSRRVFLERVAVEPPVEPEPPEEPEIKDSDGDGVPDHLDECPNTPKGAKVDERGCWIIPGVAFDFDKSVIKPAYYSDLDDVVDVLRQNPDVEIRLEGHADARGTEEYNIALSQRRADAVYQYLLRKGISGDRLETFAYGESQPIAPNDTEANMALNRRVELTVVE